METKVPKNGWLVVYRENSAFPKDISNIKPILYCVTFAVFKMNKSVYIA